MHVLLNLFGNSVENLLGNSIPNPRIDVRLGKLSGGQALVSFKDNGTGLSAERYEELTAFAFLPSGHISKGASLGLRLVRRLVERNHGKLEVVDLPAGENGTVFHLSLSTKVELEGG